MTSNGYRMDGNWAENRFQNRNGDPCSMRLVAVPFRLCFGIEFAPDAAWIGRLYHGLENR
jgi:hypothetical protein